LLFLKLKLRHVEWTNFEEHVSGWFDAIRNRLHWNVALELQPQIVCRAVLHDFLPLVLDNRARFDTWKRKRLRSQLQTTNLNYHLFDDVFFGELDNRAIRFDGPSGDVFDLGATDVRDVDFAMLVAASFGEDLDANVVVEH